MTAHCIKRNDHSCFQNRWPKLRNKTKIKTSLSARGPPGVSGALRSVCILRIGRIVSVRITVTQIAYSVLCQPHHTDTLFRSNQSINKRRRRIRVVRLTQNRIRYLRPADLKMVLRWRGGDKLLNKVFSLLHKVQIEPLMADGLFCLSYFSVPWQCYLLGSQWDSHKPPGFHLKYLKLCSEDERSFYGFGTTWG